MRRLVLSLLLLVSLLLGCATAELQPCHRVELTKKDVTQKNDSVVRVWTAKTALASVDAELASITQRYVDKLAADLPAAANKTSRNSRLDVEIRYSRTGLHWLSFVIQARTTYHRELTSQSLTTRTYDMETGERILLTDVFDDDSDCWDLLSDAIRIQCTEYFPDEEPDAEALDRICERDYIENADFSLHGMSLVLHIPARLLYPEHQTLMEVRLYYPEIRSGMTEQAWVETNNTAYYKTCALTFDDGPSRTNTTNVLNALMKTGSLATFFVLGNLVADEEDLVQKEHDNGHTVASHNYSHGNAYNLSTKNLQSIPEKVNAVLTHAFGLTTPFDRVPYGVYPAMIKAEVGMSYIQWSVDTYDWRGRSSTQVLNVVKKEIEEGDIILCHDIKDNTPTSTELICEWLAENGYIMLTVDELMAKDSINFEPDTVYFRNHYGDTSEKK